MFYSKLNYSNFSNEKNMSNDAMLVTFYENNM